MIAQLFGRAQAQNLVEGIADDGVAEAGSDIGNACAFLLGLLHLGIHEDSAAGPQINRLFGKECRLHKAWHAHAKACGKGLQKGAAP